MAGRTDEDMQEREQGKGLKRRGILAAAGAVVAGIVAKQVAEQSPVSADDGTWTFPYAGTTSTGGVAFNVVNSNTGTGIRGGSASGVGVLGTSVSNSGVVGTGGAGATGVSGT